jgi:hypothetical protein
VLQLLRHIMIGLKTARIRLRKSSRDVASWSSHWAAYEWAPIWGALMSLSSLIIAKFDHMRDIPGIHDLVVEASTFWTHAVA